MRYRSLSTYFRERYKGQVRKIPLDAGFSCPNRDGTISRGGCVFCNERGSGAGLADSALSLSGQWDALLPRFARKYPKALFFAYLQAYSNTYGPADKLRRVACAIADLPRVSGLCIGTRPDCLDEEKCAILARAPFTEVRLELGLQSASDATLRRINRGHDAASFASAARMAAKAGLSVTAHLMAGLPGETGEDFLRSVDFVASLPVAAVKFHNLIVAAGSPLASSYKNGEYQPLGREEYASLLCGAIARLRPDMTVERLNADPRPGELLAPDWAADKGAFLRAFSEAMERGDVWQGAAFCANIATRDERTLRPLMEERDGSNEDE